VKASWFHDASPSLDTKEVSKHQMSLE
jgi:hypothetical protein